MNNNQITGRLLYSNGEGLKIIRTEIPRELNPYISRFSSGYSRKEILYYFNDRYLFIGIGNSVLSIDCIRPDLNIFREVRDLFYELKRLDNTVIEYEGILKSSLIECIDNYIGVFALSDVKTVITRENKEVLIKLKSPLYNLYKNSSEHSNYTGLLILARLQLGNLEDDLKAIKIDSRKFASERNRINNHLLFRARVANCILNENNK